MIRVGASHIPRERRSPMQNTEFWRERCKKEVEAPTKLPLRARRERSTAPSKLESGEKREEEDEDDRMSVASFTSSRSGKSTWSLGSFRTQDSGFTFYANQKFAQFEKALEEERKLRQQAEEKIDKLMSLLEQKALR